MDELLGGGIDRGTSTLIVGAAGAGKSSLASQIVWTATSEARPAGLEALFALERLVLRKGRDGGADRLNQGPERSQDSRLRRGERKTALGIPNDLRDSGAANILPR